MCTVSISVYSMCGTLFQHLSSCPPRPFLWCWAVVCHPDVAAEEQIVQLVPEDFPPWAPHTGRAAGKSHTAFSHLFPCLLTPPYMALCCTPLLHTITTCYPFISPPISYLLLVFTLVPYISVFLCPFRGLLNSQLLLISHIYSWNRTSVLVEGYRKASVICPSG